MTDRLPPALASWTGALAALTPGFTVALGPLLRGLDDLVTARGPYPAADGEPDGYDGLARVGPPHRLLASQWLLADELPEEFLRRAVQRELLHLSPARRDGRPRGRVVVVADTGPSNAGAARLVQLAALVVLNRRAEAHGSQLMLRIPGAEVAMSGPLVELLPVWLASRATADPEPADLVGAGSAEADDETWILTSEQVGERLPGRRRVLTAAEAAWDADGATAVRIGIDGSRRELPLPPGPLAVSALRGRQFRAAPPPAAGASPTSADAAGHETTTLSLPSFTGETRRLILRTPDPCVIAQLSVGGGEDAAWRRHEFPAPVLAASVVYRRLVVVLADRTLTVRTVGKRLRAADGVSVSWARVDLTDARLAEALGEPVGSVYYDDGRFLVRLAQRWWFLARNGPTATDFTTVIPGGRAGTAAPLTISPGSGEARNQRFHCRDHVAIDYGTGTWLVRSHRDRRIIRLTEGDRAFALVLGPGGPLLLSFAEQERLIRSTGADGARTVLTEWDVPGQLPAVHPSRAILAGIRGGRLEVIDAGTGKPILIRGVTL